MLLSKKSDVETQIVIENLPETKISTLYGRERPVVIRGSLGVAMESFISRDGKHLFFNSLNDAKDTSIFVSTRIAVITFEFRGKICVLVRTWYFGFVAVLVRSFWCFACSFFVVDDLLNFFPYSCDINFFFHFFKLAVRFRNS